MAELICIKLNNVEGPAGPLAELIFQLNTGQISAGVFALDPVSFEQVPGAPFAYWVEERVRRIFRTFPAFEAENRVARQGLATADDFRFVRCWWEIPLATAEKGKNRWWPFAKGGSYAQYYSDLHLVLDWFYDGRILSQVGNHTPSKQYYFRAGITWSVRSQIGYSARILPAGAIFGHVGPSAFIENPTNLMGLVGLLNSHCIVALLALFSSNKYEAGAVQRLPINPSFEESLAPQLAAYSLNIWHEKWRIDTCSEISHQFIAPWFSQILPTLQVFEAELRRARSRCESLIAEEQLRINQIVDTAYGFTISEKFNHHNTEDDGDDDEVSFDGAKILYSYLIGLAFGRWAIPADPEELRKLPADPLAPLPFQAPGAAVAEAAGFYYAEDLSGESDLINSCRVSLCRATGLSSVDGYEQALATRLGVTDLRDYLNRPAGFFSDHLSVYSKSRRQAPIYWPLSTKSGNFTLWVYYPKLDDQSLPKLIADVLSPKIRTLTQEIENRRATPGGKVAELEALRLELEEMRADFLDLINRGYRPNQNDGVLITACPLAKYFRHAGFRKNLEACWKELAGGKYDWAHLAMAMWPERALEACKTDRTIAIAHGREDLCPVEPPKAARGRKKSPPSP